MDASTNRLGANHLAGEKSPYLQQHQYNPVDWYPWGEEAFQRARREDKPVFLSVGYSTCHWCHVMAHESFEDPDVAQLMNDAFVSVKVDREERPDIDKAYMEVAQAMAGRAGWPLTIMMTPDKEPFFAATYIPRDSRYGQVGMLELVPTIKRIWTEERARIQEVISQTKKTLEEKPLTGTWSDLDEGVLDEAFDRFSDSFDEKMGGFGKAPKFPSPHNLIFLLRYWNRTRDELALHMVSKTLTAMRQGGIYDQVGFGFHRYSTDSRWLVPHFEKMLYDQAMHILAYAEAYQATKEELFAQVVDEIVAYLRRDMMSPSGAFYAAEDADSEGDEGKFYTWSHDDLVAILSEDEARVAIRVWGIDRQGNYSDEATRKQTGLNILHMTGSIDQLASELGMSNETLRNRLESARSKILSRRLNRIRPHRDEKVLCDWNGLVIAALSKAGAIMRRDDYLELAEKTAAFVLEKMRPEGRLMHSFREGTASVEAFLDDYSFLTWGLIELYLGTFRPKYLKQARELVEMTIDLFEDVPTGAFHFSGKNSEQMIVKTRDAYDGATPSGNSVTMLNLVRLARLLGDPSLEDRAVRLARAFSKEVEAYPSGFTMMLIALNHLMGPSREVVIAGDPKASDTKEMLCTLMEAYIPNLAVILRGDEETSAEISRLAPYTRHYDRLDNRATAHVCIDRNCRLPTTEPATMMKQILG